MAIAFRAALAALLLSGALLAGCAGDGSDGGLFTTGAIGSDNTAVAEAPKADPACIALTSRIEGLRKEGIADKIEKASAKKYKMTQADLTKANAEFQARCSTLSRPTTAQVGSPSMSKGQPKSGSGAPN